MEWFGGRPDQLWASLLFILLLSLENLELGSTLNDEARALLRFREAIEVDPHAYLANWVDKGDVGDPCSWAGVACEGGRVVSLKLNGFSLMGRLTPGLGELVNLKYLNLNDNSFYGIIPKEIGELHRLEVLDLGYNNLHGPLPSNLDNLLFLRVLVLEGNRFSYDSSELREDNYPFTSSRIFDSRKTEDGSMDRFHFQMTQSHEKISENLDKLKSMISVSPLSSPSPSPSPPLSPSPSPPLSPSSLSLLLPSSPSLSPSLPSLSSPSLSSPPPLSLLLSPPPSPPPPLLPSPPPPPPPLRSSKMNDNIKFIIPPVAVGSVAIVAIVFFVIFYRKKKESAIKPLGTGLSGKLKKAFVEGVQSLKESELKTACEEYSNVIGEDRSDCTLFKGTLSSGVEIAVNRFKMDGNWTKNSQKQFRRRIATLSKMNHKNFVSLVGYCEEDGKDPCRMLVFEYASNGTLFEHLHRREQQADHLNWAARLRIAMGVACFINHIDQLDPPVILGNIDSKAIILTDDFAAKVVDMDLWSQTHEMGSRASGPLYYHMPDQASVVSKFGIILLELLTGRPPYSDELGELVSWASDYLNGTKPLDEMLDPTLSSFSLDIVHPLCQVIHSCLNPEPRDRPSMKDVVGRLREITLVTPDAAAPKLSPLWWAELEIASSMPR